jgi:hypothetical protein
VFLLHGAAALDQIRALNSSAERQNMPTQKSFYCDSKALNPAERARHKQLTDKLIAVRTRVIEMAKGYEFQYRPTDMSLAELADWAVAESKCCPFFDFHIDLEGGGKLLCLRLTGQEGVKAFIRAEFRAAPK